jgi:hypothetical protein
MSKDIHNTLLAEKSGNRPVLPSNLNFSGRKHSKIRIVVELSEIYFALFCLFVISVFCSE